MATVLIVDDDTGMTKVLADIVESIGHKPTCAYTLKAGLDEALSNRYDVVILDVMLPDGNGLDALPRIRRSDSSPEVIIVTGVGDADGAELAIKNGAWDYLQKPLSPKNVILALKRVLQYRDEKPSQKPAVALKVDGIVGTSSQTKASFDALARAANSVASVLITGETGTGKELFARAVHINSSRATKNFVVVDCGALPEALIESTLFGHKKGAFTGADKDHDGLIKQADGGTLFLDEVGELPLTLQKAFLRVLQEHRLRPVGGEREVESDFRVVAATNRDLDKMVKKGLFREDLLYRLQAMMIELSPLRQRREDIEELAFYYMRKTCDSYGTETKGFSPDFLEALQAYSWPGNVRELMNTMDAATTKAIYEPTLFCKHLPTHIRIQVTRDSMDLEGKSVPRVVSAKGTAPSGSLPRYREVRDVAVAQATKKYFQDLMSLTQGNIKKACQISGLSRAQLYTLLKKSGVSRFGWPTSPTSS